MPSPTSFQNRVYEALCTIPRGKVMTYKTLGALIGCVAPRAVGQALRANPFAPQVPCHRIISSNLTLGGFEGQRRGESIAKKKVLLEEEGVIFDEGGLIDASCLWYPQNL